VAVGDHGIGSDYRDKITSVLTGDVHDTGQEIVQSQNAKRLVLTGLESGVRYAPSDAWQLYATATYTRGDRRRRVCSGPDSTLVRHGRSALAFRAVMGAGGLGTLRRASGSPEPARCHRWLHQPGRHGGLDDLECDG
jgi:outer membrane receptor protein involved in Fe transport